jgi:hypothetical protein
MLPRFTALLALLALLVLATDQFTGTVVPVETEENAVQESVLCEETVVAGFPEASSQMIAVICVAATMVSVVVAVIVTTLLVGTLEGAVYKPLVWPMEPLLVPLTDQFTRVLLALMTVAVHCAVPFTVTSAPVPVVGTQEAVMVGATVVELEPQALTKPRAAASPKIIRNRSQRTRSRPK